MNIPWQDIAYLARGNQRQRRAYRALERLQVLHVLRDYTPVLVGTVPIAIDIAGSDLDVICEVYELDVFERLVVRAFGQQKGFRLKRKRINDLPVVVANFEAEFPIEIFGQPRPVREQNAYRHMDVQARLLALGGDQARREIVRLKRAGLKTEPAFARYFGLQGDPFQTLLELSLLDEQELCAKIENSVREKGRELS
jgi:hypothetical protein